MSALRSAIGLALLVTSLLASSAFAAVPPQSAASSPPASPPVAGYWDDRFDIAFHERWSASSGSIINDAVIFNGELYVAGRFSDGNSANATHALDTIARWDGRKWTNVAKWSTSASYSSVIYAMAVHGNSLYVAGSFSEAGGVPANNIARWNGTKWYALGSGLVGSFSHGFSLASWNGNLYVGGSFTSAGGVAANNIARWDGANWHAVGAGLTDDSNGGLAGLALKATPDGLYAGGVFSRSGAEEMQALARWDGARWSAAIPGLSGQTFSLDWHAGQLYAGGRFVQSSAPEQTHNTLRWDGAQAQLMTLGANPQTLVRMVRSVDGELYAGVTNGLYRWEGGVWQPFGPPLKPDATSPIPVVGMDIIAYNGRLHLFGAMEPASATMQGRYALALAGNEWMNMGQGVIAKTADSVTGIAGGPMVSGVAVIDSDFYIAADSIRAGGKVMGNLARWDGATWNETTVGPASSRATAILAVGSTLYAAGSGYDPALGRDSNFIARRDGGAWITLANDVNGQVETLAWSDGALYAGGRFTAVGATPARGVARWNGTAWSSVGDGLLYNVRALAVNNGTVYAAGSTSNYPTPNAIARWSNGAWESIGDAEAYALDIGPDGVLYAGGRFTSIGGVQASRIARWSDGAWAPLGDGMTGPESSAAVYALDFAPDGALYAGGRFSQAGAVAVSNIARYDGQWSALAGSLGGIPGEATVRDLEATAQGIYVGGSIWMADGRFSESVAIWRPGAAPQALPDRVLTVRGQPVDIAVLANDRDADGDTLAIASVTTPSQGSAQVANGLIRYTPEAGYVGTDSFGYTISDGAGGSVTSMVTVIVSEEITSIFVPLLIK